MRSEAIKGAQSSRLILETLVEQFNKHIRENQQKASGRRSWRSLNKCFYWRRGFVCGSWRAGIWFCSRAAAKCVDWGSFSDLKALIQKLSQTGRNGDYLSNHKNCISKRCQWTVMGLEWSVCERVWQTSLSLLGINAITTAFTVHT